MEKLYANIVDYLRGCQINNNPSDPLVVFTTTELMPVVKGCFRYLAFDQKEDVEQIQVYDIQYLLFVLKKEVMEIADLPHSHINKSVTDTQILNDFFEYHSGISCQVRLQITSKSSDSVLRFGGTFQSFLGSRTAKLFDKGFRVTFNIF